MPAHPEEVHEAEKEGVSFICLRPREQIDVTEERFHAAAHGWPSANPTPAGGADPSGSRSWFDLSDTILTPAIGKPPAWEYLEPEVSVEKDAIPVDRTPKGHGVGLWLGTNHGAMPRLQCGPCRCRREKGAYRDGLLPEGVAPEEALARIAVGDQGALSFSANRGGLPEQPVKQNRQSVVKGEQIVYDYFFKTPAVLLRTVPPGKRIVSQEPYVKALTDAEADREASRCLHCGRCTQCDNCLIFCPDLSVIKRTDGRFGYWIDYDYCKGCGICFAQCPGGPSPWSKERKRRPRTKRQNEVKRVIKGNHAVSMAVKLCRVAVIAAYPITPQTTIVEELSEMCASGAFDADFIKVESENSAMAAVIGASTAGVRSFTATSSHGLLYMHEVLHWASGARLPIVLANVNLVRWGPAGTWPTRGFRFPARYRLAADLQRIESGGPGQHPHGFQARRAHFPAGHADLRRVFLEPHLGSRRRAGSAGGGPVSSAVRSQLYLHPRPRKCSGQWSSRSITSNSGMSCTRTPFDSLPVFETVCRDFQRCSAVTMASWRPTHSKRGCRTSGRHGAGHHLGCPHGGECPSGGGKRVGLMKIRVVSPGSTVPWRRVLSKARRWWSSPNSSSGLGGVFAQ